jgi:hypothetical protein
VFENRVLRKMYRPKRDEVTGTCRKLYIEELRDLYSSPEIRVIKSRRKRWVGHVARVGGDESCMQLMRIPEGRRPLGRPTRVLENNIKIYLK